MCTADPRTLRVWTAQAHLHAVFLNKHPCCFVLHRGRSQRLRRADCVMICAIFCKGLGHLWILVPARGAGTDPLDSEGQLTFLGSQRWMQSRVGAPNPYRVKGQLYISYNVKFLSPLTFLSNEKMWGPTAACFNTNTDYWRGFVTCEWTPTGLLIFTLNSNLVLLLSSIPRALMHVHTRAHTHTHVWGHCFFFLNKKYSYVYMCTKEFY